MKPFTKEELGDSWDTMEKAMRLRGETAEFSAQLERMGASIEIANARLDFYLTALCRLGVITAEQYANMVLECEEGIHNQVQSMRDKRVNAIEMQQAEALSSAKRRLVTPQKPSGIIVPGR